MFILKRNLFVLVAIGVVSSCSHGKFPELRDDYEETILAENQNIANASFRNFDEGTEYAKSSFEDNIVPGVPNDEVTFYDIRRRGNYVPSEGKALLKDEIGVSKTSENYDFGNNTTSDVLSKKELDKLSYEGGMKKTSPSSNVSKPKETSKPSNVSKPKEVSQRQSFLYQPSSMTLISTIYFDNGSSSVNSEYSNNIKDIVKLAKDSNALIYVFGHSSSRTQNTDYVSHKLANFNVSERRAESVANALIRAGAKKEHVVVEAFSDTRPEYLEVMPEGERLNRRAEIYLAY